MWNEIPECLMTILKLFAFLGIVGFIYYIALVIAGLQNIVNMVTGSIGILFAYLIFGGTTEIPETFWLWNPACLMLSPVLAIFTVILIWQIQD